MISFAKQIKKLIIITRGEKGAVPVNGDNVTEVDAKKNCVS